MFDRIPDQTLLSTQGGNNDHLQASRGKDYIIVYSAQGNKFTLYTGKLAAKQLTGHWYNPKNGQSQSIGNFENKISQEFTPPSSGYGNDWVLVVDDPGKNYTMPAAK